MLVTSSFARPLTLMLRDTSSDSEEQAVAGKIPREESIAFFRMAKHIAKRNAALCSGKNASRPAQVSRRFPPFKPALASVSPLTVAALRRALSKLSPAAERI